MKRPEQLVSSYKSSWKFQFSTEELAGILISLFDIKKLRTVWRDIIKRMAYFYKCHPDAWAISINRSYTLQRSFEQLINGTKKRVLQTIAYSILETAPKPKLRTENAREFPRYKWLLRTGTFCTAIKPKRTPINCNCLFTIDFSRCNSELLYLSK